MNSIKCFDGGFLIIIFNKFTITMLDTTWNQINVTNVGITCTRARIENGNPPVERTKKENQK